MKRMTFALLALCLIQLSYAIPARQKWTTKALRDGSTLSVCLVGDERQHYFITRDSIVVLANEEDDMVYATINEGRLTASNILAHEQEQRSSFEKMVATHARHIALTRPRRSKNNARQNASARARAREVVQIEQPYIGERSQLVLLVDFPDQTFRKDSNPHQLWNDIFNTKGFTGFGRNSVGSVADYFYDQSYGQLSLSFDIFGPITMSHNYSFYGRNNSMGEDVHPGEIVREAIAQLLDKDIDWNIYDWDNDGYIDQVFIVYAGRGENEVGQPNLIWPHQWTLTEDGELSENGQKGNIQIETANGPLTVDQYGMFAELDASMTYGTFGTLCHEYSHCFGLPDLYDTLGDSNVVGSWDIMSSGSYNHNGFCPAGFSAYERWLCGWLTPEECCEDSFIEGIAPLSQAPKAYLLRNECLNDTIDEFFILENRQPEKWDAHLPGKGLLVTHIDYSEWFWLMNEVNTDSNHRRLSIVPANNRTSTFMLGGWTYPYYANDSLTSQSRPSTKVFNESQLNRTTLDKKLTHICIAEDNTISFSVSKEDVGAETNRIDWISVSGKPADIYSPSGQFLGHINKFSKESIHYKGIVFIRFADGQTAKLLPIRN